MPHLEPCPCTPPCRMSLKVVVPITIFDHFLQVDSSLDSSKTCALVVGINAYEHLAPLKNCVQDAAEVEKALRKVGVKRLTSASDCTYKQLTDKTNEFLAQLREGDVALVYLATHAAMYRNQNVVLATDSTKTNMAETSLPMQLLLAQYASCPAARTGTHANLSSYSLMS